MITHFLDTQRFKHPVNIRDLSQQFASHQQQNPADEQLTKILTQLLWSESLMLNCIIN